MLTRYPPQETIDIDALPGAEWVARDGSETIFASYIDREGRVGPFIDRFGNDSYMTVPRDCFVVTRPTGAVTLMSGSVFREGYLKVECKDG